MSEEVIKFIKQLFCNHYYKYDMLNIQLVEKAGYSLAHKTCKYCGKECNELIKTSN